MSGIGYLGCLGFELSLGRVSPDSDSVRSTECLLEMSWNEPTVSLVDVKLLQRLVCNA